MLPPPSQGARVVARGVPGDWARACAAAAMAGSGAGVLKAHAGGTVWRATVLGRECVLKCVPVRGARRRIQSLLRVSPAWRHWRNACWLRERGIAAGEPLAIVAGRSGAASVECLVVEYVRGATVLELMARGGGSAREEHEVARALGRLAASVAGAGRLNRDAKPSNLVVTSGDGGLGLAVIDCADLRRCRRGDRGALVRMLASAVIEPMGCGVGVRRTLRMRAVLGALAWGGAVPAREDAKSLWREVEAAVAAHGDPRPRENPLA